MAIISLLEKDQIEDIIKETYENFEKSSGKVPEWVKAMAHCPEILKEFTELFKTIMKEDKVEPYLKWKIAYTVSQTLKCPFCVDVTTKMLKKLGASDKMMEEIKSTEGLPQEEKEILELVKDVTLDGYIDNPEILNKLKEKLNEAEMVEIVSVIGLFNYINRFNNTFAILPE